MSRYLWDFSHSVTLAIALQKSDRDLLDGAASEPSTKFL